MELTVPGANLHYDAVGSGPVLLLIVGGNGESAVYAMLARALADRFTVVSYDRRGYSRSRLHDPASPGRSVTTDGDDVHRLLAALTDEPAHVFGSSSGAIVGLDHAARHPAQVATLVSHEPPAMTLLPDGDELLGFFQHVHDVYRSEGAEKAMRVFGERVGLDTQPMPPVEQLPPPVVEMLRRIQANVPAFLDHELRQYTRFRPDTDALAANGTRVVLAGGEQSRGFVPYRPNLVLGERLGLPVVDFPGDHVGYVTHPDQFAAKLAEVLTPRPAG